jgi:hypothetical protein
MRTQYPKRAGLKCVEAGVLLKCQDQSVSRAGLTRCSGRALWPLLLVAVVVCIDVVSDADSRSASIGVLDEPAHLAT